MQGSAKDCKPTSGRKEFPFTWKGQAGFTKQTPISKQKQRERECGRRKARHRIDRVQQKEKKEGSGGKVAKFMVAISFGKGAIECERYIGNVNAEMCADFIHNSFPGMFEVSPNPTGKLFLQDGDPSQNSKAAKAAMDSIGCRLFTIPPRSPDLNPIENIFHLIGKVLKKRCFSIQHAFALSDL